MGKGENAGNQNFLLFPQCFLPYQREKSANAFDLVWPKTLQFSKALNIRWQKIHKVCSCSIRQLRTQKKKNSTGLIYYPLRFVCDIQYTCNLHDENEKR